MIAFGFYYASRRQRWGRVSNIFVVVPAFFKDLCYIAIVTTTQGKAIKRGRQSSSNQHSELIIHRPDGRIRAKVSHGHDPFPPRGWGLDAIAAAGMD